MDYQEGLWVAVGRYIQMLIGIIIGAIAVVVFLLPNEIVPTNITGIAVFLNEFFGTPVGVMVVLLNIPVQMLGYRMLPGGVAMLAKVGFVLVTYSVMLDLIAPLLPREGLSDDRLLNAIFGGVLGGISSGLVFRAGGNFGGTNTIALIVRQKTGIPLSSTFLYADLLIVLAAALIYGWEPALFSLVTLFITGLATDYVLEGPSVVRTAVIITEKPRAVADEILYEMQRGVSGWTITGMYTQKERTMLYVTIGRSETQNLRDRVLKADPAAFMVIQQGHVAYGGQFKALDYRKLRRKQETTFTALEAPPTMTSAGAD
ncbi:MAG: YitT family protein [Anaerolineales bacterium]